MRRANRFLACAAVAVVIMPIGRSAAQSVKDEALAGQLFQEGRELAKQQRWAEACPKFETSLRYDDALGTRLNLANCYKHLGKLATAWGLYRDAADLARRDGDAKRRDYALQQAAALVPRLARLTIARPTRAPAGFTVTRDGVTIDPAVLGSAVYVDPGPHEVTATAPGFEPFKTTIAVAEARSETVVVPDLVPSQRSAGEPHRQAGPATQSALQMRPQAGSPLYASARLDTPGTSPRRKYIAVGIAATGVVMTGIGLFLGARASLRYDEAKRVCRDLICEDDASFGQGRDLIAQARTNATLSTIFVAAGIAAVGTGVAVWLLAPRRSRIESVRIIPAITDRDLGVVLAGRL